MSDGPVVCGHDGSAEAKGALHWAAEEARLRGVPLRIVRGLNWPEGVRVGDEPVTYLPSDRQSLRQARESVDEAVEEVRTRYPELAVAPRVEPGGALPLLLEEAVTASVVVMGSRGLGGFSRLLLGSVSSAVAEHATCPVIVVRPPSPADERGPGWGRIVAAVDGSPEAQHAVEFAVDEAARRRVPVTLVHALYLDPVTEAVAYIPAGGRNVLTQEGEELLEAALVAARRQQPDVEVTTALVHGHPVASVAYASAGAVLLVVGTRGRSDVKAALLGSVSRGLLHHASAPVAVVPAG